MVRLSDNIVRARLYLRVSTGRQAAEGFSLDAQEERLVAFCKSQGWEIAGTYIDGGESAKSLDRPDFQRMIADCEMGDCVLVYRLDRLTRSSKDIEYLIELAEKRNIYLKSATEDINTSTSSGRFHLRLIVQFGQYERETTAERSAMGKKKRATSGVWQGGKPPFGYVTVDSNEVKAGRLLKRLDPDPLRAHIVPIIFDRYLAGDGTRQIAKTLNEQHVGSYTGTTWTATAVSRILSNPTYCGDAIYNRPQGRINNTVRVPSQTIPPLISREVFEQAQRVREQRLSQAPRHATGIYVLAGVSYCAGCGAKIFGQRVINRSEDRAYTCSSYRTGRACSNPVVSVSALAVEDRFVEIVDSMVKRTDSFDSFFDECMREYAKAKGSSASEIERVKADLAEAEGEKKRWDAKYAKGHMEEDEHEDLVKPIRERIKALKERLAGLSVAHVEIPNPDVISVVFSSVIESWAYLSLTERKALVQSFCSVARVQIVVHSDRRVELRPTPYA